MENKYGSNSMFKNISIIKNKSLSWSISSWAKQKNKLCFYSTSFWITKSIF